MREITSICVKRIHIALGSRNKAGHWWFEIESAGSSSAESFGCWPRDQVSLAEVFSGVAGELNDGLNGQIPARDPHHGESGDEEFHPLVGDGDSRTEEEIANCVRAFALNYTGKWQWFIGWGQNCHTFQREALKHCCLHVPANVRKAKL